MLVMTIEGDAILMLLEDTLVRRKEAGEAFCGLPEYTRTPPLRGLILAPLLVPGEASSTVLSKTDEPEMVCTADVVLTMPLFPILNTPPLVPPCNVVPGAPSVNVPGIEATPCIVVYFVLADDVEASV